MQGLLHAVPNYYGSHGERRLPLAQ